MFAMHMQIPERSPGTAHTASDERSGITYFSFFVLQTRGGSRGYTQIHTYIIDAVLILQTAKYVCTCPATIMGAVFFKRLVSANHMHPTGRHSHGLARDVRGIREANISALGVRSASDVLAPAVGIPNAMTSRRSHLRSSRGEERHVAHKPNPSEDTIHYYRQQLLLEL